MTKFLNISTDNTLGGSSPSDETVSSQKAIKDYVDTKDGNFVTLNTLQTLTSGKKIFANDAVMAGNQTALLATISNSNTYTTDNAWVGRYICGAKNLTFLMGTYRTMAGIGAHSWTNAQTGAGASWADFYLNPDGSNAVYIGGNLWTKNSGWMKIKNSGNTNGTVQVNRNSISSPSWKNVACWDDNISKFNNDAGYTTNVGTVTSVNNTSPDSNGNVSLSIPTVNNPTITFTQGGTTKGTITLNQSGDQTIEFDAGGSGGGAVDSVNGQTGTVVLDAEDVGALPDTTVIPTDTSDLTNGAGFITSSALSGYATETWVGQQGYITGITSSDVTTALGYTPYNSTNPSGYQANVIETVKVNGTALTPSSKAVDITVPTNNNQLTNGAGYITSSALSGYQTTITGGATTITSSNLTASRALISNSSGKVAVSAVTSTELGHLSGVTSAIQTQLNGKQAEISAGTANNIVAYSGTAGTLNTLTRTTSVRAKASASDTYIPTEKAVATSLEDKYDASNPAGYTSNIGTVTSVNNVSPVNGNVTLSIPSEVTESTVSGWGFTKNTGTVTSVNNVSPVSGNVTLSIPTVNDATLTIQQNGTTLDTFTANSSTNKTVNIKTPVFNLFDFKWSDYELNDQSWLRADTFSWQDGTVYSDAYNHLVSDINGKTSTTETIGSYTITYYLATDGHKIVLANQATTATNIYNESGIAWYYILDTTNQRFKLPRTKYGFTGLRDEVGKYVGAGLPNHTHATGRQSTANNGSFVWNNSNQDYVLGSKAGSIYWNGSGSYDSKSSLASGSSLNTGLGQNYTLSTSLAKTDNVSSDGVFGNSTTVQPPATQMYLYFYVGNFSQSATEQTAGLNSSLFNGKVDLNAANLSIAGKSLISGLGMPSDNYIDLTLGASGSTYTAPANGYVSLAKTSGLNSIGYIRIGNDTNGLVTEVDTYGSSGAIPCAFLPVKKNDIFYVTYNLTGNTALFRFIYAEGE